MRNFFIFILTLISVFPIIQAQNFEDRTHDLEQIIGGHEVPREEYLQLLSHIVAVRNIKTDSICTGSVIGPRAVLLAAHCFEDQDNQIVNPQLEVFIGPRVLGYDTKRIMMSHYRIHPDYVRAYADQFDLALLFINEEWPEFVKPMEIISHHELLSIKAASSNGMTLGLAGYGAITTLSENWSNQLRTVNKRVMPTQIKGHDIVIDQRDGFGTCVGDSGGPAMLHSGDKKKIVAVVSFLQFPNGKERQKCSYDSILSIVYREMISEKFEWVKATGK